jgi:hypothetical protein
MNQNRDADNRYSARGFPGLKETYSALREVLHEQGVNIAAITNEWALHIKKALAPDGADTDFETLCDHGCNPLGLAASVFAAEFYPMAILKLRAGFGMSRQRAGHSRNLRQAADILKKTVTAERIVGGLWLKLMRRHESLPEPPSAMIRDLENYAKMFEFVELFSRGAGIKSNHDLPRFIVTGYVHLATGRWHDKEVSALLQGGGTEIYDETAHRVWRNRNFSRLNRHYCTFLELLFEVGEIVGASRMAVPPNADESV